MHVLIWSFLSFQWTPYLGHAQDTYVTCLSCPDVASPRDCRQSVICGKDEICFAREYTDYKGLRGFRLGCEDKTRCHMFLDAKLLFGKRHTVVADPATEKCYDCCPGEECNGHLCQGEGHSALTFETTTVFPKTTQCPVSTCPTTTQCPLITVPRVTSPSTTECPILTVPRITAPASSKVCPDHFIKQKDKCYLFYTGDMKWDNARAFCKKHKADLVSVTSEEEQDYLVKELTSLGDEESYYFWIGGAYSQSFHEWEWVERSPLVYKNWATKQPLSLSHDQDYHVAMLNPTYAYTGSGWWSHGFTSSDYNKGKWLTLTNTSAPFICEKLGI